MNKILKYKYIDITTIMRKDFFKKILDDMKKNEKIIIITADIGYGILDEIRNTFADRVINAGSSEMLMIGIAVGLSYEGYIPICYTITPFLIYRPFEMLRNYVNYENLNIKLVGSGRDKDYIHDGFTHWSEDDIHILSTLNNITLFKDSIDDYDTFMNLKTPCYFNLKRN
jgi:transketolase